MGRKPLIKTKYRIEDGKIVVSGSLIELPKECCYDKLPNLKKSGILVEYEPWQIEEITKCATNIEYFCKKYIYVVHPDRGKILLELRHYQERMLSAFINNRHNVVLCPRQGGKSMIASIYILHNMLFNKDKKSAILANKASTAKEIFSKIRMAYQDLPYWLQIGVVEWHKTSMILENGCHCFASATSADGIRGLTINGILFLDEFAIIRRNIADEFFESVYPTIAASSEAKIIISSTPKGLNHFHELWKKAQARKNDFFPTKVEWNEIPGRDENYKLKTIKDIGIKKWNQEFECNFIGSSSTLIRASILEDIETKDPLKYAYDGHLKIWEMPKGERTYVLGCDTAKGTGNDYSVIQVLDFTAYPFTQVAQYRSNEINTRDFGDVIFDVATKYNNAYVIIENNDIGQAVVDYLWGEKEYENMVNYSPTRKRELGIRSTKKTKAIAHDMLQILIDDNKLNLCDSDTVYELSKYTEWKSGLFRAEEGENDDCVTSLLWAIFILKTNYLDTDEFKDERIEKLKDEGESDNETLEGNEEPVDLIIKY